MFSMMCTAVWVKIRASFCTSPLGAQGYSILLPLQKYHEGVLAPSKNTACALQPKHWDRQHFSFADSIQQSQSGFLSQRVKSEWAWASAAQRVGKEVCVWTALGGGKNIKALILRVLWCSWRAEKDRKILGVEMERFWSAKQTNRNNN